MRRIVLARTGLAVMFLTNLSCCTPPQYDSQTDQLITTAQTDTDTLLVHLGSLDDQIASLKLSSDAASVAAVEAAENSASYSSNVTSYNKIQVDLLALKTRIDAEPNPSTSHLDIAIQALQSNIFGVNSLESYHQSQKILDKSTISTDQALIDAQYSALLQYELVLKPGSSTTSKTQS